MKKTLAFCVTEGEWAAVQRSLSFGKQQLCTARITPAGDSVGKPRPANTAYAGAFESGVKGLPEGAVVGL